MRFSKLSGAAVLFSVLVPFVAITGCGDDGSEPELITLADFAGSWELETYRVTDASNPVITVELISLGATFDWVAAADGSFTGGAFVPAALAGQDLNLNVQGSFSLISQDSVQVTFNPEYPPFLTQFRGEFELSGNRLSIIDQNTTFDFGAGTVAAIFEGSMVRQ
jgi:hypothetical protein